MKFLLALLVLAFFSCKDDHAGHDHSSHEGHDHAAHDDHSGHDHGEHEGHEHGDHEGHDHAKEFKASLKKSDEKEPHVHGSNCTHDHAKLVAPNGGTVIRLGGDAAILELVLDKATGELKVFPFILDGVKTSAVKLEQTELVFNLKEPKLSLTLKANEAGVFSVVKEELKSIEKFEAETGLLEVEGLPFDGSLISYPEGN